MAFVCALQQPIRAQNKPALTPEEIEAAAENDRRTYGKPDWALRPRFMNSHTYVLSARTLQFEVRQAPSFNTRDITLSPWRSELRGRVGLGRRFDFLAQVQSLQSMPTAPLRLSNESIALSWAPQRWGLATNPTVAVLYDRVTENPGRAGARLSLTQGFGASWQTALNLEYLRDVSGVARRQTYGVTAGAGFTGFKTQPWPVIVAVEATAFVDDRADGRFEATAVGWNVGPSVAWRISQTVQMMGSVYWVAHRLYDDNVTVKTDAIQPTVRLVMQQNTAKLNGPS
jgi:hypothetical protein